MTLVLLTGDPFPMKRKLKNAQRKNRGGSTAVQQQLPTHPLPHRHSPPYLPLLHENEHETYWIFVVQTSSSTSPPPSHLLCAVCGVLFLSQCHLKNNITSVTTHAFFPAPVVAWQWEVGRHGVGRAWFLPIIPLLACQTS